MKYGLILFLVVLICSDGICETIPDSVHERAGMEQLMSLMNLRLSDLTFRDDYTKIDQFRLAAVSDLMHQPYNMIEFTERFRDKCTNTDLINHLSFTFEISRRTNQSQTERMVQIDDNNQQRHVLNMFYNSFDLNRFLNIVYDNVKFSIPCAIDSSLALLSDNEKLFLLNEYREIILEDTADESKSAEVIDSIQKAEEEYARQFMEFGSKFRKDFLTQIGINAALSIFRAIQTLQTSINSGIFNIDTALTDTIFLPRVTGRTGYLGKQKEWKIGGTGDDLYSGEYHFIIDFGGDDQYNLSYDPKNPHGTIIIDLSGNDIYNASTEFTIGSGCFSVGLLFDMAGDDIYNGTNFSCGSGYFGFGLLYDEEGHDKYHGDTHSQGAGTFGTGVIIDRSGSDIYSAALLSQGFGFTEGIGMIVDQSGNDNYIAGNKYKDILRYDDHYLSLSQGFGYGLRPYMSGGIGAIIDFKGNDNYISDIFGQGSSYWWSLGLIYDSSGNDQYISHQYAQGAGTHMSLGILLDENGQDFYRGKGLMQGCGHDYSCGLILDRNGNDIYQADDLSQAAGSANGFGILIDNRGDDAYYVLKTHNTQGYGNPRRDFGSLGLFLDLSGVDRYDGNGLDGGYWKTNSKWGGGLDWDFIPSDSIGESENQ